MNCSTSESTRFRSALQALSSCKARFSSSASEINSLEESTESMFPSHFAPPVHRNRSLKNQYLLSCIICTSAFSLTSGWSNKTHPPLLTNRDTELREILLLTVDSSAHPFLSEKNAQLNNLRRQYFEKFNQTDWVTEISVSNTTGLGSNNRPFFGFVSNVRSLVQFSGNWELYSGWSLLNVKKGKVPTQFVADSDLPTLENIEVTYGKMRSIEVGVGLPEEVALLHNSKTKSIFSGLSLKLHPLEQKITTTSPHYTFQFHHGWSNLMSPLDADSSRTKLQRTRPQFSFDWKPGQTEIYLSTGLEWYSDRSGALSRILGQRPNALSDIQNSSERQWRLFQIDSQARYRTDSEAKFTVGFQRVSNTLGASSSPAWSLSGDVESNLPFSTLVLGPALGVTAFRIPSGSVPPFRLPLELTPGSVGTLTQFGLGISFPSMVHQSVRLSANFLTQHRIEPSGLLQCNLWEQKATQSCRFGWINLAWSLKLPTNL